MRMNESVSPRSRLGAAHRLHAWSEIPARNIDRLDNVLRIGTDSTNAKTLCGHFADVVIRKAYDPATMATDDAYFRARYGVP